MPGGMRHVCCWGYQCRTPPLALPLPRSPHLRVLPFHAKYCARLVRMANVNAKEKVCENAFAPAVAVIPMNPASRRGQHQLPTSAGRASSSAAREAWGTAGGRGGVYSGAVGCRVWSNTSRAWLGQSQSCKVTEPVAWPRRQGQRVPLLSKVEKHSHGAAAHTVHHPARDKAGHSGTGMVAGPGHPTPYTCETRTGTPTPSTTAGHIRLTAGASKLMGLLHTPHLGQVGSTHRDALPVGGRLHVRRGAGLGGGRGRPQAASCRRRHGSDAVRAIGLGTSPRRERSTEVVVRHLPHCLRCRDSNGAFLSKA